MTNDAPAQFPVGDTTVTWTVTDDCGHTAQCPQTVTAIDNQPPLVTGCPANITVNADADSCSAVVTWTAPTATDNCGIQSFTSNYNPGDTFPVGPTVVIYTATDIHGNVATCTFTVTVQDYSDFAVTIELQGAIANDTTRCILFTFADCATGLSQSVRKDVAFPASAGDSIGAAMFTGLDGVPCSAGVHVRNAGGGAAHAAVAGRADDRRDPL